MKAQLFLLMAAMLCLPAWADEGDGQRKIELTFDGDVVLPSCVIEFETGGDSWDANFGDVNVSDLRYFGQGVASGGIGDDRYSKQISLDSKIKISGCSAGSISKDGSGKQLAFSIAKNGATEWVTQVNSDGGYMAGGIAPTTGATQFAAKIMVPDIRGGAMANPPTSWVTLTNSSVTSGGVDSRTGQNGVTGGSYKVAFSDLIAMQSGSDTYWLLPVKMNLGMRNEKLDGKTTGNFAVSATVTAEYY